MQIYFITIFLFSLHKIFTIDVMPELKKNILNFGYGAKWGNTHIFLDSKEIHLPTTLLVPLIHKLKIRKLFSKRDLMHIYIMLKQ